MEHYEKYVNFVNGLPKGIVNTFSQIEKALLYVWFADRVLQKSDCTIEDIEGSLIAANWNVPKTIKYRFTERNGFITTNPDTVRLDREILNRLDEDYLKYIESSPPTPEELEKQFKVVPPPLLSKDEISDAYTMARAYVFLYFIENSARKWIDSVLAKIIGDNWWKTFKTSLKLTPDQKEGIKNILGEAEETKKKKSYNKLLKDETNPLFYLDFGGLPYLLDNIDAPLQKIGWELKRRLQIKAILKEINDYRDAVAHNRRMTTENIQSLETRYNEWRTLLNT
jgi:hypothetical protein